jgi:hypothetical protein
MRTIIVLLFLSSCAPSVYYVTTDSTFEQVNSQPYKRKLIYLDQEMANLNKLDSIAVLINKKRWKKLDQNISTLSDENQQFLISIKQLIEKEFSNSYRTLNSLEDGANQCQVKLLKIDCLYELGTNSVNFKSDYQQAMDCTQSEIIKSIINTRYRFLRYGQ